MSPSFHRLMAQATRLTRAGDLQRATSAIQAALGGAIPAAAVGDGWVIDVEAREVEVQKEQAPKVTGPAVESPQVGRQQARVDGETPARSALRPGSFITGSHTEAAGTREYKLFVPSNVRAQALPLVVMLHGCTQNPDDFALGTGMNDAALEQDFFVLYPAQAQNANPSRCWNWFKPNHQRRDRGEPAVLAGMTREIIKRYSIDPGRVYVAGLSAGGAMAAILGDAYPDLFAAVGVHSGLPTGSAKDARSAFAAMKRGAGRPSRNGSTPPTIVFHGDRDTTVHPVNGEHVVAGGLGAAALEIEQGRSAGGRSYTRRIHRDTAGRAAAEHWVVHGAGHAWSGGRPQGSYTDAKGPDATAEMLRFFFSHRLHRAG